MKSYILLKYMAEKAYIDDFLNGSLYMNSLYFFWKDSAIEKAMKKKDEKQKEHLMMKDDIEIKLEARAPLQEDSLEGAIGAEDNIDIDNIFKEHVFSDCYLRPIGMKYCNVLCFYMQNFEIESGMLQYDMNNSMRNLGEYVALIKDQNEFMRRVETAIINHHFDYAAGPVIYRKLQHNGHESEAVNRPSVMVESDNLKTINEKQIKYFRRDCFDKIDMYSSQHEWRIALYRGIKDTSAYRLEVGNLRDIVDWCKADDLTDHINQVILKNRPQNKRNYYGDRSKIRREFLELGDRKVQMILNIG